MLQSSKCKHNSTCLGASDEAGSERQHETRKRDYTGAYIGGGVYWVDEINIIVCISEI